MSIIENIKYNIVKISKLNEVHLQIDCSDSIAAEFSDHFSFTVPGASFIPSVRKKHWDGKIRLFSKRNTIYTGLLPYVEQYCSEREYEIEYLSDFSHEEFSVKEAIAFIKTLNLPDKITPRDYQIKALISAIRSKRRVLLSPTASGKSLIIYMLMRYYDVKTLIITPTTALIHQMFTDFEDYGFNSSDNIGKIYEGQAKNTDNQIYISTWQSLFKQDKEYFDQFELVIVDECHLAQAKSITSIMEKLTDCKYRFGFTGTLSGQQTHKLVLEGLFGSVKQVTTTSQLMEDKHIADLTIKSIVLQYSKEEKKLVSSMNYQEEMDFLVSNESRNNFLSNLVCSLEGNTLLLYQYVEKHGKILHDLISKNTDKKVFFISGEVDGEERNSIRHLVENEKSCIIVASVGTTSTGVNLKQLHNVIFASPSKSRIRNLQSIGRGLRKSDTKTDCILFDIADDLSYGKKKNYTLSHFIERIKIYAEEKFRYKLYRVTISK